MHMQYVRMRAMRFDCMAAYSVRTLHSIFARNVLLVRLGAVKMQCSYSAAVSVGCGKCSDSSTLQP